MKKRILFISMLVIMAFMVVACGEAKDERTIDTFKTAFIDNGIEMTRESVPLFQVIGAKDGFLFYNGPQVVKIYEFDDEATLAASVKENSMMTDWPQNGKFLLETSNEQAISIFNNVAK